jgi:hypothetical protein
MYGGRNFVDILAARSLSTNRVNLNFIVRYADLINVGKPPTLPGGLLTALGLCRR